MSTTPINPTQVKFVNFANVLRWAQSVYQSLNSGITLALGKGSNSSGVFNTFDRTNGDGIMVRIGSAGSGEPLSWDGGTLIVTIPVSTLNRKPTGWILCDIDKPCYIYRSSPPTSSTLVLKTSDATCSITVWIF